MFNNHLLDTQLSGNLDGWKLGRVLDNDDPKHLGRIKCEIAGVLTLEDLRARVQTNGVSMGGETNLGKFKFTLSQDENGYTNLDSPEVKKAIEQLPWICQLNSGAFGNTRGSFKFSVPEINSLVIVEFPFGDIYSGVYSGYIQGKPETNENVPNPFIDGYPDTYGVCFPDGFQISYRKLSKDGTAGSEFSIRHPSSTSEKPTVFKIDKEGNLTFTTVGSVNIDSAKDITVVSAQNLNCSVNAAAVNASGELTLKGSKIKLVGPVEASETITVSGDIKAANISVMTHTHVCSSPGSPTSPPA